MIREMQLHQAQIRQQELLREAERASLAATAKRAAQRGRSTPTFGQLTRSLSRLSAH